MDERLISSARRARAAVAAGTLRGRAFLEAFLAVRFDERRPIVLCAVGFEVREPWLRERLSPSAELVFYDSSRCAVRG